jgi:predicted RNase H-like HicB family nuclease
MRRRTGYSKIVQWSDEDQCFVGTCPELFYGGCHGDDEKKVFAELCSLVDEIIELYRKDGRPLPTPVPIKNLPKKKLTLA